MWDSERTQLENWTNNSVPENMTPLAVWPLAGVKDFLVFNGEGPERFAPSEYWALA